MLGLTSILQKEGGYMIPVDLSDSANSILTFQVPAGSRIMCSNCTIENMSTLLSEGKLTKTNTGYFIEVAMNNLKITRSKENMSPLTILKRRELLYTDNVTKNVTLASPYYFRQAVVFNNEIHTLMGETTNIHYRYDGLNWFDTSTIPYTANNARAIVFNGKLHLIGGQASGTIGSHYVWDGLSWTKLTNFPNAQGNISPFIHNNELHLIGPYQSTGSTPKTCFHYRWNESDDTWELLSTVPFYVSTGGAISVNGKIHAFGNSVTHYIWDGTSWTQSTDLPVTYAHDNGGVVNYNNELHILGGTSASTKHYKWDEVTATWVDVSTLPYTMSKSACCVFDGKIHLISSQTAANKNKYYEWDGTSWKNNKDVNVFNLPLGARVNGYICNKSGENLIPEKSNYLIEY